jgi:hypothetical protein
MNLGAYPFLKTGPLIIYFETFLSAWQGVLETTYPELQMIKIAFPYIEISRVVGASPNRAWDLLTDTFAWEKWGPSIIAVRSSERYIGKGSHGQVKTALRFWVPFVVTEFDSGKYWSWHIFGIGATGHRLERLDAGKCRLIFQVPIWAAPYLFVCKIALDRIVQLLNKEGR